MEQILTLPWSAEADTDAEPDAYFSKTVERAYGRVPAAGEEICLEDGPVGLYRRVETVRWDNDGTVELDLEPMFGDSITAYSRDQLVECGFADTLVTTVSPPET